MVNLLYTLASFQDYGWFIALISWAGAGVIGRLTRRGAPEWAWLPWIAATMAAAALAELVSFSLPVAPLVSGADHVVVDLVLGGLTALAVSVLIGTLRVRRLVWVSATAGMLAVAIWRTQQNAQGAWALAIAGTLAAIEHMRAREATALTRAGLAAVIAAFWFSSAGPIASSGVQPRAWVSLGEWSAVWSGVAALAGSIVLVGAVAPWFVGEEWRREARVLLITCGAWIVAGLGLAAVMSEWARRMFESQLLDRTHLAAAFVDKAALAQLTDANFRLSGPPVWKRRASGSYYWQGRVDRIAEPIGIAVRQQLTRLEQNDTSVIWSHLEVARGGWLPIFGSYQYASGSRTLLILSTATERDWSDWAERRASVMPLVNDWASRGNAIVHVRTPLVEKGRMLGWLILGFPRFEWLAAQAQPRLQAYLIVALGLGLVTMVAVQRVRTREREAARSAAASAKEADQLKTAFLAKVSHELRTPIQSVLGYGELLRKSVADDPTGRARLAALRQHGELMLRLVNDLLDLSAIQAGAFRLVEKPTALTDIVRQTIASLRPRAEAKGLVLELMIAPDVPEWVLVDGGRVRQVILNLVGNALKFTDRGRVDVAFEAGPGAGEVTLIVSDTGPGIRREDLGRLFRAFERLDSTVAKEGTGLGLALAAALCRGMGGNISAESEWGVGATFRAQIRATPCPEPIEERPRSASPLALAGRRVLVADDNDLVRQFFVETLREVGAHCTEAADGESALTAAAAEKFDAVMLDFAMPRLDGVETVRRLRATHGAALRIVGVSAHAGDAEREAALAAGMDAFLVKPVSTADLVGALAPLVQTDLVVKTEETIARLRVQFHSLAAAEGSALAAAVAAHDFTAARTRAHHLMNSATAVRDDWLFTACAAVERAAIAKDGVALAVAWEACEVALQPWRSPDATISEILSENDS